MTITFPTPPQAYNQQFMTNVLSQIERGVSSATAEAPTTRILLLSPNGTVFELVVGNDGNLATVPL